MDGRGYRWEVGGAVGVGEGGGLAVGVGKGVPKTVTVSAKITKILFGAAVAIPLPFPHVSTT